MKISIQWLNEWIEVADIDPQELAHRLTMAGLEVEGIDYPGHGHDDIVVGKILEIREHPKADRLVICEVDAGEGKPRQIVCGAKNMVEGDLVPVALPGAEPPGIDFAIGTRKVMGVESSGMLCSGDELGLPSDVDGLMILDPDLILGTPIFDALGLRDVILEIDLTPNRADCLSHLGVAREVAALLGRSLRPERLEIPGLEALGEEVGKITALDVQDSEGCPQYHLAVLENIQVGPSPAWLERRLVALGQRSINNVVDITNFILLDVGQPLHAFDFDLLHEKRIVVRRAREGEEILGIDHNTYKLDPTDLVIADGARPVAIAGVMGGAETEVSESTKRILLECAYFDPTTVRRSARRHGLHTESSHRYERGIDPGALAENINRALDLLIKAQVQTTGQAPILAKGMLVAGAPLKEKRQVTLDIARVNRLLGIALTGPQCRTYLESIGLEETDAQEEHLTFAVPTHRGDLERPVDLIEEIARLHGYDKIPQKTPMAPMGQLHQRRTDKAGASKKETILSPKERQDLSWIGQYLLAQGILEAVNYSFMSVDDLDRLGLDEADRRRQAPVITNPLVKSQGLMRTTLVPSLLDNVQTNYAQRRQDVALFELGRRYFIDEERRTLGLVLTGVKQKTWSGKRDWDFFDAKGIIEALGTPFAVEHARWARPEWLEPYLHPGVQAVWMVGEAVLATVGQLHPAIAQREEIEAPVFLAELDLEMLLGLGAPKAIASLPPRYPAIVRDFALLYEQSRPYGELEEAIRELVSQDQEFASIFETMELFDVYQGAQVPEGLRSLAITVTYRSAERTLKDEDVEAADRKLLKHLEERVGARLR